MRKGFIGCVFILLAGTSLARAQTQVAMVYTPQTVVQPATPGTAVAPGTILLVQAPAQQVPDSTPQIVSQPIEGPGCACAEGCGLCGDCDEECVFPGSCWVSAEWLIWWTKGVTLPPLVTTGSVASQGIIGRPGTTILIGDMTLQPREQSGARLTAGTWLDDCQVFGIEASGFFLGRRSQDFTVTSNQFPIFARPFFDLNTNMESSALGAFPGLATGSITVTPSTRLWGAELDLIGTIACESCYRVDVIGGFRYADLREDLNIFESTNFSAQVGQLPNQASLANSQLNVTDTFTTRNQFYGGQFGAAGEFRTGPWFLDLRVTLGVGETYEHIGIRGQQVLTPKTGAPQVFQGGFLALSSNSGFTRADRFALLPEVGLRAGCQICRHVRAFVGYDFLYWSEVVHAADQIDLGLDTTRIPNFFQPAKPLSVPRPTVPLSQGDYWAQGVSIGLEVRW